MDMMKMGAFLQELRKEKGLTQEQLAELTGVARRTVSRWETGSNLPDLDILIELSDFYDVDLREILNGERKSEKMNEELKETVRQVAEYSNKEKANKARKLNRSFILGALCFLIVILNHQFGLLSLIFKNPIDDFMAGALTGLALVFELIGLYNNNHEITLKQKKQQLFLKKKHQRQT
ncbi:MAG: helix-turn-helix domain-containing protein [Erysipelotrichaceae bacterium]|nr:helix-turn-helix domain-containing protein [Erysipelotrichaceae bacterium]